MPRRIFPLALLVVLLLLLSVAPFLVQAQGGCTPYPSCVFWATETWSYLATNSAATPGATWTPNSATLTAAPLSATPMSLLPEATGFSPSSACPEGEWSPDGLDPRWSLACSHCLPATGTPTPGGFDIGVIVAPSLVLPTFATFTPVPTGTQWTVTPVPLTPTTTATASPYVFLVRTDSPNVVWGSAAPVPVTVMDPPYAAHSTGVYSSGSANAGAVSLRVNNLPFSAVTALQFDARADWVQVSGASPVAALGAAVALYRANGTLAAFIDKTTAGAANSGWHTLSGSVSWSVQSGDYLIISASNTGGIGGNNLASGTWYLDNIRFTVHGGANPTPTPLASATSTTTASPAPSPTLTPPRQLLPLANCTVPVYRDMSRPVDVDISFDAESACYRLVPEIDIDSQVIIPIDIHVEAVDFCFDFYTPVLQIAGVTFDLQLVMAAMFGFFLVRWGLFN